MTENKKASAPLEDRGAQDRGAQDKGVQDKAVDARPATAKPLDAEPNGAVTPEMTPADSPEIPATQAAASETEAAASETEASAEEPFAAVDTPGTGERSHVSLVSVPAGTDLSTGSLAVLAPDVLADAAGPTNTGNIPVTAMPSPPGWQPSGSPALAEDKQESAVAVDEHQRSARREREAGPEPASALTADRLLTVSSAPPVGGWRLWLYRATFGYVNVGDSDKVRIQRALEHRIAVKLGQGTRYVPVLSRKGGVGKTTITTLLGLTLADIREDRVIAVDANPDRGTLSDRSPGRADFTARHLVKDRFRVDSFSELSNYVARDGSRLDILASDTDPAVAHAFDESDYRAVTEILDKYYSIVLTDSGTGMVHSVMNGTLDKADGVVLVSGGSVDEARLASETLSWLEAHGRSDLVAKAIVVINMSAGEGTLVNVDEIEDHFKSRVRTVVRIPYDRHLAEGSRIELAKLRPATRSAAVELAALVVDELQEA